MLTRFLRRHLVRLMIKKRSTRLHHEYKSQMTTRIHGGSYFNLFIAALLPPATEVGYKLCYRMGLYKVTCGKYTDLISSNSIVVLLILSFVHHHTVQNRQCIVLSRTKVLLWLLPSACFCCPHSEVLPCFMMLVSWSS